MAITITPNGKTAYVANYSGTVTPITPPPTPRARRSRSAAPVAIAITPNGKTAYAVSWHAGTVTPITTATNTPGKPIHIGRGAFAIAITR